MERMQSTYENLVEFNLSESGVRPLSARELVEDPAGLEGLLDQRTHTSNAAQFLAGSGYGGGALYRDEPVVIDGPLITASGIAPVHFARAIFDKLELYAPSVTASWFKLYGERDPAGFFELMSV